MASRKGDSRTVREVFVYRPGAIGDTILTLPALAALRRRFPTCRMTFAGNAAVLPLLPVDERLSADDPRLLPLFEEPPRPWRQFDLQVVFARQPALGDIQRDPIEAVSRARHVADWLVEAIDPGFADRTPRLAFQSPLPAGPDQPRPFVIHPGAGGPLKCWPAANFARVVEQIGWPVAVIAGPADDSAVEAFASSCQVAFELWKGLDLATLAAKLSRARGFLGNDSGISHLAAALGVPTAAVYLTTDPAVWGIRGRHVRRLPGNVTVGETVTSCQDLMLESAAQVLRSEQAV